MFPSVGAGATGIRSIAGDDNDGVRFVYGNQSNDKPAIVATVADPDTQTIEIHGTNFDANLNDVWFTQGAVTAPGTEPRVRVLGAPSTAGGTLITVAIPAAAGPGDVMVKVPGAGHDAMSNAFPTDLVGSFGVPPPPPFSIDLVSPSVIEALLPGTEQLILIQGAGFDTLTVTIPAGLSSASFYIQGVDGVVVDTVLVNVTSPGFTGDTMQIRVHRPVFDIIFRCFEKGEDVKIVGFGHFRIRRKASRRGRNPQTGDSIEITARRVLTFKPSKGLKQRINMPSTPATTETT